MDILTKRREIDISNLASILEISEQRVEEVYAGAGVLNDEQADSLTQLFLMFLGKHLF